MSVFRLLCRSVACVAAFVGAASSQAATIRHDVNDIDYRNHSAQPKYAATGYVSVSRGGGSFTLGTGTLVSPQWVLTAAHVVTLNTSGAPTYASASQVTFGQGTSIPGSLTGTFGVSQIVPLPAWNNNLVQGNDLALIKLSTAVSGVTPATLFSSSLGSEISQIGTFVGYGRTGTGNSGSNTSDRTRRAFDNYISAFGGETTTGPDGSFSLSGISSNVMFNDFDKPGDTTLSSMRDTSATSTLPLGLEGQSAPGDSGGGVFFDIGGVTYLAGITSFGTVFTNFSGQNNSGYGDIAGYTRVSQFMNFITATVPEPSSLGVLGILAIAMLRRRRPQ